jgi:hypothetical protein
MASTYQSLPWRWIAALLITLITIDLILRDWALWRSARRGQTGWFVVLLIVNTLGILPAIYLLLHRHPPSAPSATQGGAAEHGAH